MPVCKWGNNLLCAVTQKNKIIWLHFGSSNPVFRWTVRLTKVQLTAHFSSCLPQWFLIVCISHDALMISMLSGVLATLSLVLHLLCVVDLTILVLPHILLRNALWLSQCFLNPHGVGLVSITIDSYRCLSLCPLSVIYKI